MPTQTDTFGANYVFGFAASDAPAISNFTARNVATSDVTPEVFVTAVNGEGLVEAIAITKPANRMVSLSFNGYINSSFNKFSLASGFTFLTRAFFITKISDPIQKGNYVEVTIDAVSYSLVTSTTAN